MAIKIFHRDKPAVMMPMIAQDARLVVWLGAGSKTANMNFVDMSPGEQNVPHSHPRSEDTIFILEGRGTVEDITNGLTFHISAGQVVHVPVGLVHAVKADRGSNIVSVGGPSPADEEMLRKSGVNLPT